MIQATNDRFIPRIIIGTGALVAISGLFVTLAAYQIMPQCINTISQLGALGQGIGYSVIAAGTLIFVGGNVTHLCLSKKLPDEKVSNQPAESNGTKSSVQNKQNLEELFEEDPHFLQNLPNYPGTLIDLPDFDSNAIHAPVVRGAFGRFPFIAIQLKCLSSTEDIINSTALLDRKILEKAYPGEELKEYIEREKSCPMLILLLRVEQGWKIHDSLIFQDHLPIVATSFLSGFNGMSGRHSSLKEFSENQIRIEAEKTGLALLKRLMKGEEVEDLNGMRWKLDR